MKGSDYTGLSKIFTSYLKTVVKNARYDYISRMKRIQTREESMDDRLHEVACDSFDAAKIILRTALKEQPLIRQQIIFYSYYCGYSAAEIAVLLQCSIGYVNRQKRAAIHALKKNMKEGTEDS